MNTTINLLRRLFLPSVIFLAFVFLYFVNHGTLPKEVTSILCMQLFSSPVVGLIGFFSFLFLLTFIFCILFSVGGISLMCVYWLFPSNLTRFLVIKLVEFANYIGEEIDTYRKRNS